MSPVSGVRADLVERFKREIREKTYRVKSDEIAAKIAQKLKENETLIEPGSRRSRWSA